LDKFLSESNRSVLSYRLLISTTSEGLHHIAQGTVDAQEKPVFILERPDLEASPGVTAYHCRVRYRLALRQSRAM
jgi:Restriction endonuclease